MKIDLAKIDLENFMVHPHFIGDHEVVLVQPVHIGAKWSKDTMHFRSLVVDKEGTIVSASFKKFFNWDEKPDLDPAPVSLQGATLMEKVDGSTLIFSRYKGHTVIRTRGTVDARKQENGHEIDVLKQRYPKFFSWFEMYETSPMSFLFEWTSPLNRIVLNYGDEPDMHLIGMVMHSDYSYFNQSELDTYAKQFDLKRPRAFSYDSVNEMKASVEALRDQEGLCVYYNEGQSIRKVKSAHYLFLHRAKSDIASIEKVIDLYTNYRDVLGHSPSYTEFYDYLATSFDHEIATMARADASRICDAMDEVEKILTGMASFVEPLKLVSRKDAAIAITQAYGTTGRTAMCFKLLDGKLLDGDAVKKLIYQVLK